MEGKKGLIDFNGISNSQGLFYAKRLGNYIHCTFIFIFLCSCFLRWIDWLILTACQPISGYFMLRG